MTKQKNIITKLIPAAMIITAIVLAMAAVLPGFFAGPILIAEASAPSDLTVVTERGENILDAALGADMRYFSNSAVARTGEGLRWSLSGISDLTSGATNANVLAGTRITNIANLPQTNLPNDVTENFRDAVRMDFRGYTNPGDSLMLDGFANIARTQRSHLFYFSAWVYSSQTMYIDITVDGSDITVFDQGRRSRIPANTWTEIGRCPDSGEYWVFRTNGAVNMTADPPIIQRNYEHSTAARATSTNNLNANDDIGNPFMSLGTATGWVALKLTTHRNATGFSRTGADAFDSGFYYIAAPHLWVGEFVDTSELNRLVMEFIGLEDYYYQFYPHTWAPYEKAFLDGFEVLMNTGATLQEVWDAVDAIAIARARLVRFSYREDLNVRLRLARRFRRRHFETDWDWAHMQNAVAQAERAVALTGLPGEALTSALLNLNLAMDAATSEPSAGCGGCGGGSVAAVGGIILLLAPLAYVATKRRG